MMIHADIDTLKEQFSKLVSMFNDTKYGHIELIGILTMIENYSHEAKEKILVEAGCKDMFYDQN